MNMSIITDMRALIASTVSVACGAALVVPMILPQTMGAPTAVAADAAAPGSAARAAEDGIQSLPLRPLDGGTRSGGERPPAGAVGLAARDVEPYALVGIVWSDATTALDGVAQVRTRSRESGEWSGWHDMHVSAEHGPDAESAERRAGTVRGGTDPLWVGDADGVQARVLPGEADTHGGHAHDEPAAGSAAADAAAGLPDGLRLELVTPGDDSAAGEPVPRGRTADAREGSAQEDAAAEQTTAERLEAELDQEPAQDAEQDTEQETEAGGQDTDTGEDEDARRDGQEAAIGRPGIVTRPGWGANEGWREPGYSYTKVVKTVFVHHTAGTNNYTCAQAPSVIRSIYQYHTQSQGWRDIGYNFLVDKCGTVYEGRAGGVARAVLGAHTYGFNHNSMGVAVLGSYNGTAASSEVTAALARLSGWKLGLDGRSPTGTWRRVSAGGKYARGTVVTMHNISGHRDGFSTECPGDRLYGQLPAIRAAAGRL
jgi:hypothetical protein